MMRRLSTALALLPGILVIAFGDGCFATPPYPGQVDIGDVPADTSAAHTSDDSFEDCYADGTCYTYVWNGTDYILAGGAHPENTHSVAGDLFRSQMRRLWPRSPTPIPAPDPGPGIPVHQTMDTVTFNAPPVGYLPPMNCVKTVHYRAANDPNWSHGGGIFSGSVTNTCGRIVTLYYCENATTCGSKPIFGVDALLTRQKADPGKTLPADVVWAVACYDTDVYRNGSCYPQ